MKLDFDLECLYQRIMSDMDNIVSNRQTQNRRGAATHQGQMNSPHAAQLRKTRRRITKLSRRANRG